MAGDYPQGRLDTASRIQPVFFSRLVNLLRSLPFIILLTLMIPVTRFLVGTSIGIAGTIVPLAIAAAPFVARLVEQSLLELSPQLIHAMIVIGATPWQIVRRVYPRRGISVARPRRWASPVSPSLAIPRWRGLRVAAGLAISAIRYGYYNYRMDVMLYTVLILIVIVEGFQTIIHHIAKKIDKKI
ncbi:MAG: ABC transporter permease subunit [Bacillus subtilis]|nr:ABC transporter permease subunit [Bacillus subtilis]